MPEPKREVLVVLDQDAAPEAMQAVRTHGAVTQILAPALVLVSPANAAWFSGLPGVRFVLEDEVPEAVRNDLDASERILVDAWEARRRPKRRRGEGAAWDAPGFLPPDVPPET
jgi:hypothetical protein